MDGVWEEGSGYVKMARNLNFLEKNDNEVDGSTSEEKEDWSNPSTEPMTVMTTTDCCCGVQAH